MTVACCGSPACDRTLKDEARDLMIQMTQERYQAIASFGVPPMSRGAKCYCGSGRKFKKCCGKDADVEGGATKGEGGAAVGKKVAAA